MAEYIKHFVAPVRRDDMEANDRLGHRLGIDPASTKFEKFLETIARRVDLIFELDTLTGQVKVVGLNGNWCSAISFGKTDLHEFGP